MKKDSLYTILATALLGWIGYATVMFQNISSRLATLEDRSGIRAAATKHPSPVWANPQLVDVERLLQKKEN